jgi:hypothetical protein
MERFPSTGWRIALKIVKMFGEKEVYWTVFMGKLIKGRLGNALLADFGPTFPG